MQWVWVMILFLPAALSQRFRVFGPGGPVFAVSGSDVILPCSVRELDGQTSVNAVDLNVTWSRSDLRDSLIHFYGNLKDLNTGQIPSYRERTAVFKEELQEGNTSLRLSNVRITDEGEYKCTIDSKTWKSSDSVLLRVEVFGSQPEITVESYDSEKISLLCESKGWRPEPDLQWVDSRGVNLTAEVTERHTAGDLFSVKSRMVVKSSNIDTFSCRVTQRLHMKEKHIRGSTIYEYLPNPLKTAGIVIGVLLLVGVPAGVLAGCLYKERRKKKREIREVIEYLRSDGDTRLLHHNLSPLQWDIVKFMLLNSEEELEKFNLRKFDPSDRGVQKLQKVIAASTTAVLESCGLTERSCAVLASVLKSENSTLKSLNLSKNKLQDSGVDELCEGLKNKHCKLEKLRLSFCSITEKGCADLTSALTENPSSRLKYLDLSYNEIGESGLKRLKDKFPELTVEFDCNPSEFV